MVHSENRSLKMGSAGSVNIKVFVTPPTEKHNSTLVSSYSYQKNQYLMIWQLVGNTRIPKSITNSIARVGIRVDPESKCVEIHQFHNKASQASIQVNCSTSERLATSKLATCTLFWLLKQIEMDYKEINKEWKISSFIDEAENSILNSYMARLGFKMYHGCVYNIADFPLIDIRFESFNNYLNTRALVKHEAMSASMYCEIKDLPLGNYKFTV